MSPPAVGPFLSHFFHKCNKNTRGAFATANTKMPIATLNDLENCRSYIGLQPYQITAFYLNAVRWIVTELQWITMYFI